MDSGPAPYDASRNDKRRDRRTIAPGTTSSLLSGCPPPRVLDRLPDLLWRQRRRQLGDAVFGERVHHAVRDAGRTADGTRLAAALGAERIGLAGCGGVEGHLDRRNVFCA